MGFKLVSVQKNVSRSRPKTMSGSALCPKPTQSLMFHQGSVSAHGINSKEAQCGRYDVCTHPLPPSITRVNLEEVSVQKKLKIR